MADPGRLPRRLAIALAAALVGSVLSGAWLLFDRDTDRSDEEPQRFAVGEVVVERRADVITLSGSVASDDAASDLVDAVVGRPDVSAVIDQLEITDEAPRPRIETIDMALDRLDRLVAGPEPTPTAG